MFGFTSLQSKMDKSKRRKEKLKYWINKGCSEIKAEELIYRYGY